MSPGHFLREMFTRPYFEVYVITVSLSVFLSLLCLSSISDALLELCVMPKDEDILQLVSICLSVNTTSAQTSKEIIPSCKTGEQLLRL